MRLVADGDRMSPDPPPDAVSFASDPLLTVAKRGPAVAIPGHLEDAGMGGYALGPRFLPAEPRRSPGSGTGPGDAVRRLGILRE
jgi:hypothetical protein